MASHYVPVDSLRGQLLVASPALLDPNFERTVVLIAEHDDSGAMGIVLNREAELSVAEASDALDPLVEAGAMVHSGGPVQPAAVVIVAEFDREEQAGVPIFGNVGFVAGDADFDLLAASISRARVFAGLAGWAPGQLEAEIERDDWIVEQALADDVFADEPDSLWSAVLERKGGSFALLARMPPDPSLN